MQQLAGAYRQRNTRASIRSRSEIKSEKFQEIDIDNGESNIAYRNNSPAQRN
jgi:hypothetical protein